MYVCLHYIVCLCTNLCPYSINLILFIYLYICMLCLCLRLDHDLEKRPELGCLIIYEFRKFELHHWVRVLRCAVYKILLIVFENSHEKFKKSFSQAKLVYSYAVLLLWESLMLVKESSLIIVVVVVV